ncbi:MAG: DUF4282 domain-containing protein [Candidatus Thiodiazotropha sp.]
MEFLSFESFISTEVLIVFYYLGAIILPFGIWLLFAWIIRKYEIVNTAFESTKEVIWNSLKRKQKITFVALFGFAFLFMELFWRMLFEFLIAYMQIRDALLHIQP